MPLSEHEQRIFTELEESLSHQDPRFARSVSGTTQHYYRRRVLGGVVGFIVGLLIMTISFTQSVLLGLLGVAVMFVAAFTIQLNARLMVRESTSVPNE
jgi:uncharacterized membrane protein